MDDRFASYRGPLPPDALARLGKGSINVLEFSPDGARVAAGGVVGLFVYDAESLNEVWQLPSSGEVISLSYSPGGEILAVGTSKGTVNLVDASNGQILQGAQGGADDEISLNAIAWTDGIVAQGGLLLAAGFNDGNVFVSRISGVGSGDQPIEIEVRGALQRHPTGVTAMAFNPNGKVLVTGDRSGDVNLWDAETLQLFASLEGHDGSDTILDLVWSPDSERLVSSGEDGTIIVWDIMSFEPLQTLTANDASVIAVAFTSAGDAIASASIDGLVRLWPAGDREPSRPIDTNVEELAIIAWSPELDRFATASSEGELKIWTMATADDAAKTLHSLTGYTMNGVWVAAGTWSPSGDQLAAGLGQDVIVWDPVTNDPERTLKGHASLVTDIVYSPDGERLASSSRDESIIIWDLESGDALLTLDGHSNGVSDLDWSPDGSWLASAGSLDDTAIVWDPATGEALHKLPGNESGVWSVAWSPDSQTLAAGTTSGEILFWDVADEMTLEPAKTLQRHLNWIGGLSWSPDGEWLVSAGADNRIVLTSWIDETTLSFIGHMQPVRRVAFSPDGEKIASASRDGLVIVWDANPDTTSEPLQVYSGHTGGVNSISWSPDGNQLASGSDDGTVIVWGMRPQ